MAASNDSEPRGVEVSHLKQIAFFGGGRWGTVFFEELCKHVPSTTTLLWVTRDAESKRAAWQRDGSPGNSIRGNGIRGNIEFIDAWQDRLVESDGAIVATSIDRHYKITRDLLSAAVPVLCEKPLAATREQLDTLCSLARQNRCPFGIHLEFAFLSSFDDFLRKSNTVATKRIQVEWFDPEIEMREGIEKRAEYQCDIVSDQWPHVWSLISRSIPAGVMPRIDRIEYSPARTRLLGTAGDIELDIQLSRRHTQRRRLIDLNDGQATFDFRIEPPTATLRNLPLNLEATSHRPLAYSIKSFLSQLEAYQLAEGNRGSHITSHGLDQRECRDNFDWTLSVDKRYEFLVQSLELSDRLRVIQSDVISRMLSGKRLRSNDLNDLFELRDEEISLVLDRWLPAEIASGAWYRPGSRESDRELATQIVRSVYQRT